MAAQGQPPAVSANWLVWAFAIAASLALNLSLRLTVFGNQLDHVSDDFSLIASNSHLPRGAAFWSRIMADEPGFLLYDALRVTSLGPDAFPHHVMLGLLLSANALLAFWLVWRLSGDALFSLIFLLLLQTLPGASEAEYWIAAPYPLLRLFLLSSAHLGLSWLQRGGRWLLAGSSLLYGMAVFTHESALGFAGVLAVLWLLWSPARSWRHAVRFLFGFFLTAAVYLILRQTQWFGIGRPGLSAERRITSAFVWQHLQNATSGILGKTFLDHADQMMRAASLAGTSMIGLTLLVLVVLFVLVLLLDPVRRPLALARGVALGALVMIGSALFAAGPAFPEPYATLHFALRAMAVVSVAMIVWRAFSKDKGGAHGAIGIWPLATLGLAWYFCAFAANLFWYIASRHYYTPSVGASLVLASLFCLPFRLAPAGERRDLMCGITILALAIISGGFYLAKKGESQYWLETSRLVRRLEGQLRSQQPSIPHSATLVVLDLPGLIGPAQAMPPWGLRDAARVWYRDPSLAAGSILTAYPDHFRIEPPSPSGPAHYEDLLLFTFRNQVLERQSGLLIERDGRPPVRVQLAPASANVVRVREGVPASQSH